MSRAQRRLERQAGSTYILALLMLLILTAVALTLSLVTQNEMLIGTNDRASQQIFYAADTGIHIATAKALIIPDKRALRLDIVEPTTLPNVNIRHRLEVSPFVQIESSRCNLCDVADEQDYRRMSHVLVSNATRIAWNGPPTPVPASPTPLAQKRVGVWLDIEPWPLETLTEVVSLTDPRSGAILDAF